jgi:DnaK suppressor protein
MNGNLPRTTAWLYARQFELADRLARLESDARRSTSPLSPDSSEQAVQRANDEVVDRLLEGTRRELTRIEEVLARVADGTYGRCDRCGEPIAEARLEVLPDSTHCVRCAREVLQRAGGAS